MRHICFTPSSYLSAVFQLVLFGYHPRPPSLFVIRGWGEGAFPEEAGAPNGGS